MYAAAQARVGSFAGLVAAINYWVANVAVSRWHGVPARQHEGAPAERSRAIGLSLSDYHFALTLSLRLYEGAPCAEVEAALRT